MNIIDYIVQNLNNNTSEFKRNLARLLQTFTVNGNLNVPQPGNPVTMYNVSTYFNRRNNSRFRRRATNARGALRVIVSQAAQQIQINDYNVISRATDMLKNAITFNERNGYRYLASQV
ncbi:11459_t:CDS:1 [Funneliformis geosporum]|uniref:5577_t:CDS:1 n=1 Tax=Funneliformis geosporum TaxID=1117311 RepID=A0A9W4SZ84_9GLOM|nr:5577_t:CDS:1 [Funneliformis geosporum]CAI2186374.1 11459_t:CDS:1 [Funneliformis geosporum]